MGSTSIVSYNGSIFEIANINTLPDGGNVYKVFTSREAAGQVLAWLVVFQKTFVEKRDLLLFGSL